MEVYAKKINRGYLNKDPEYKIPSKPRQSLQSVQALKARVTSVDLINHGSELDLVVEGSNLWFYNKLSMYDKPIKPAPCIQQSIGTCLHVKISGDSNSNLRSLKDGQKVRIGFHTHFSSQWPMDIECHTKVILEGFIMGSSRIQSLDLCRSTVVTLNLALCIIITWLYIIIHTHANIGICNEPQTRAAGEAHTI